MKTKFNLVGDTFTHLTDGNKGYSVARKEAKLLEWVQDNTGVGTFYVDNAIELAFQERRAGPKYAWLLESKYITPQLVEWVKENAKACVSLFDAIFTHNQELLCLSEKFKWVPAQGFWIHEPGIYEKSKMVSMISSNKRMCEGHLVRLQWVEKLRGKVDLFGRGFHEIVQKEEGLCDYFFSIAIENGQYETYFTEKILDCFATGTIPIYLGAPDIAKHFNPDGIIDLKDQLTLTPELYYSKREAIQENLEIAKSMEILEDYIWSKYLT